MKTKLAIASLFLLSFPTLAITKSANIFFPVQGVICDKKGAYCADQQGLSLKLTERYLGKKVSERLKEIIGDGKDVDLSSYTLSNGVHCESKEKKCYKDRYYPRTEEIKNSPRKCMNNCKTGLHSNEGPIIHQMKTPQETKNCHNRS
ncbi:YcgJ family protein [Photorhabdus sp. SF281]|uniref:YcgJ family protein n=1 Tax=Photorhabdus sp. SF281 TaxID=3459527 RepID=UPI004043E5D1